MKIRNPKSRQDLNLKSSMRVLEVGGGHSPHPLASIVVDKFVEDNSHRCGDISLLKHQKFIQADGESLPFRDKEFDYVICCHVLEHVDNPVKFLNEQFRVAKKGYIETPSLLGEFLYPRESHKWILHEHNNVLYLLDKKNLGFNCSYYFGELFQDYLPKHSIGFKILSRTHPNMFTIRIEWESDFQFEIEPQDPNIRQFFSTRWQLNWADQFFPKKSLGKELFDSLRAFIEILISVIKSKIFKKYF